MEKFETEQEQFWAGEFGDNYILRNNGEKLIGNNLAFFSKIFNRLTSINSLIEFGANIGLNIIALKQLLPSIELAAIEINENAVERLKQIKDLTIYAESILNFRPKQQYDMVLIAGVLIHIDPNQLKKVYELLYQTSQKYICISGYYNPKPVEVEYRGHHGKLFKRDFAGEMLDQYPDLKLRDYGFVYHRDYHFPCDDSTWFVLEK